MTPSKGTPSKGTQNKAARDSVRQTLIVATVLCVACSVIVSSAAIGLRGIQNANKLLDQKKNVLIAAGLFDKEKNSNSDIDGIYEKSVTPVLIDLATGDPVDSSELDPSGYDQREAAGKAEFSTPIDPPDGLGSIKRREKFAFVYQVKDDSGAVEQVVLPVYGKGLWSTLYGFLAVDADMETIRGIAFYEHGETPGLGGEIENPKWKNLWLGKELFDTAGEIRVEVVKGAVLPESDDAKHQIDGLSGATITSKGVSQLVRYWIGPDAFGPYLQKQSPSAEGHLTEGGAGG